MNDRKCSAWIVNDRIARQEVSPSDIFEKQFLFGYEALNLSPYTFVHIDLLNQGLFKRLLVRHGVALILDLRFDTVFNSPKFSHRKLIEYFYERNIIYIDCKFFSSSYGEGDEVLEYYVQAMKSLKGKNFWTVCLFDDEVLDSELLPEFRSGFRSGENRFREVHPEFFFGKSVWSSLCKNPALP